MRITSIISTALVCVGVLGCGSDSEKANHEQQASQDAGTDATSSGDDSATGGKVGDPCETAETCPAGGSGTTVCKTDWPGGYCAVEGCADHGHDCPNDPGQGGTATTGGKCVLSPAAACLALCASDSDCREGYACVDKADAAGHGSGKVCVPKASGGSEDGGMSADGGEEMGGDGGGMGADGGGMGAEGGGMGADGGGMGADGGGMGADGGMMGGGGGM